MVRIEVAASRPAFWKALESLEAHRSRLLADTVRLAEIPSTTGHEEDRAAEFRSLLQEAVGEAHIDGTGNVLACLRGQHPGPALAVVTALDSPYLPGTDPVIEVRPERLTGWGVCRNAFALASLTEIARSLHDHPLEGLSDIWFIGTVGSELAGDLRGISSLFPWLAKTCGCAICLQGTGLGRLDHWSVGTYRGELTVLTPGGHCWRDSERESALRLAMRYSQILDSLPPSGLPRGLYNPARLDAGDAWNTIPSRAVLCFELRSDDEADLQRMIRRAQEEARLLTRDLSGCQARLEQKGFRHATGLYPDHPLVDGCRRTQAWAGLTTTLGASSADASVCMHWGVPAVTLGLGSCVGTATSQETLDIRDLRPGLRQAFAAIVQNAWPEERNRHAA